jgi:hypothetical protein
MALHRSQLDIETHIPYFSQCVDFLVPFDVLSHALYRPCQPRFLPIGHGNVKLSLFPREIVRPED